MKTLARQQSPFAKAQHQIDTLNSGTPGVALLPKFADKLTEIGLLPLRAQRVDTLQINVGKLCNQVCKHCHVDAGPDRTEIMTRETFEDCLTAIRTAHIPRVDLTGGAPEMNPHFRWFVEEATKLGCTVIVRCNLTILLAGKQYEDLPQFFAKHRVHVVSSLPCYEKKNTDGQRGIGVFEKSLQALHRLNAVGYGTEGTGLFLDLVYNPVGAFLPPNQIDLQRTYKRELFRLYGIEFTELLAITNLPVSRFLDYLVESGSIEHYLSQLVQAFNPLAASEVMCRSLVSVGWDGKLYDCDFNQMLEMGLAEDCPTHVRDFDLARLEQRSIRVDQHCFGCTAGAGSSCGGQTSLGRAISASNGAKSAWSWK